jgi:hypothetical protein
VKAGIAAVVLALAGLAHADEADTLESFGAKNPACAEWSDGCVICRRDAAGVARCSTPGIACQPKDVACEPRGAF